MTTPNENPATVATPAPAAPIIVDENAIRNSIRTAEIARSTGISTLGEKHGLRDKALEFIGTGKSVDEFRAFVLENLGAQQPITTDASRATIGLKESEAQEFSLNRLISAQVTGNWKHAGFEREVCQATAESATKQGRKFQGNLQIPTEVLAARKGNLEQRDLNVANSAQGGYLVNTDLRSASFIDLLRNKMLVRQLGATVLTGLEGNISIPKKTSASTAYWIVEGQDLTESTPGVGQVNLAPKTIGAYTELTRKFLLQSSMDAELFTRTELATVIALGIDRAVLRGSGVGAEPLGIINLTGVGSVVITTGTPTFAKMVDLETEVAIDNADLGKLAYVACAQDRGIMKKTEKASSTGQYVWTNVAGQPGVGEVNGYLAYATNQLAADSIIFGNWEDAVIGEWGILDLLVNPYSGDVSGKVRISAMQDADVAFRRPESFARTALS